jgi:Uncharacterised nucleotidyltransferase
MWSIKWVSRICLANGCVGKVLEETYQMACVLSPEFRLVAACAIWPPSDYRAEAIRAAAGDRLVWTRCVSVARRHQVIGLVHEGLARVRADVPSETIEKIGAQAATLVRENLSIAREALRLQRLFDDAGLPVLFVKGASLAILAFGNLGLRSGQDIDLLVDQETLSAAVALIMGAGYSRFDPPSEISDARLRLLMPLRKDLGFVHQVTGLRIELHWRLFLNPHAMDETSIMATSRVVPLAGPNGLRTLSEQNLFAYLCVHGAFHWWYRLKWLADINAIVATASEAGTARLLQAAEARGAGRAAAQALLLCQRLFGTIPSIPFLETNRKSLAVRWLETTALSAITIDQNENEPRNIRFGTTRGSLSTFLLGRSLRYRVAELKNHLVNQTDVLRVPLPQRLWFLYPVLRLPLWAWRHCGLRRNL